MKNLVLLVFVSMILCSCEVTKYLTITDGSKSDASITMAYEYSMYDKPVVQWDDGLQKASERCKVWGYDGAEWFGGGEKKCLAYNGYGNCIKWQARHVAQCTGSVQNQVLIKEVGTGTPVQTEKEKAVKELKDAKSLLDQGIITQDEYNQISNRLKPIILK